MKTQLQVLGEVSSNLVEKLELNTYRYLREVLVKNNQLVSEGEPIIKYTNGTYLYAPYNLVIKGISIGEVGEICQSSHYIEVMDTNNLILTLSVDEADLPSVQVDQEVSITVNAYEEKEYTGRIVEIEQIGTYASNGSKFKTTILFENDGNIRIGMSANCTITTDKAENVIAVPVSSIQTQRNEKYVVVVNEDGTTKNVTVETGLSNSAYVEIKSGLSGGETVQMIVSSSNENSNNTGRGGMPTTIQAVPGGGVMNFRQNGG